MSDDGKVWWVPMSEALGHAEQMKREAQETGDADGVKLADAWRGTCLKTGDPTTLLQLEDGDEEFFGDSFLKVFGLRFKRENPDGD